MKGPYELDLVHKNGDRKTVQVLDAFETPPEFEGEPISNTEEIPTSGTFRCGGMFLTVFWGDGSSEYDFSVSENKLIGAELWRAVNLDHANLIFSILWNQKLKEAQ